MPTGFQLSLLAFWGTEPNMVCLNLSHIQVSPSFLPRTDIKVSWLCHPASPSALFGTVTNGKVGFPDSHQSFFFLIVFNGTKVLIVYILLCRPSEDSLLLSAIPVGSPSKDWQSSVGWGDCWIQTQDCIFTIWCRYQQATTATRVEGQLNEHLGSPAGNSPRS